LLLGKWNTKASRAEYDRLIGEWLAGGRCLSKADPGVSVAELALAYWRYAKGYYGKADEPTGSMPRIRVAVRTLRTSCHKTLAMSMTLYAKVRSGSKRQALTRLSYARDAERAEAPEAAASHGRFAGGVGTVEHGGPGG
jgi:hypothetical protein